MPIPQRVRDWTKVKVAFLERAERPTYGALSAEFAIPEGSIRTIAADEGWQLLRLRKFEQLAVESDATQLLVQAAQAERAIADRFREAVLVLVRDVLADLESLAARKSPGARYNLRQTASFTLLNAARTLQSLGVVGLPKALREGLDGRQDADGEGWRSGMLQQIQIMVGDRPAAVTVRPAKEKPAEAVVSVGPAAGGTPPPAMSPA